jgi:acetyl-CoA acetyltransferase family protein
MTTELVFAGPGARTPMAEYSGTPGFGLFKDVSAIELGAIAAKAALERAHVKPADVNHVIFGNALQTSNDAIYGARHVGLKAGVPIETPALTVNRLCGSGFEAVVQGARLIRGGEAELCLVGGMESMSQAPHVMHGLRDGVRFGAKFELEDLLFAALIDPMCGLYMAQTAEKLAQKYSISRAEQDAYALRSHREGARAVKEGMFGEEIVPVEVKRGRDTVTVTQATPPASSTARRRSCSRRARRRSASASRCTRSSSAGAPRACRPTSWASARRRRSARRSRRPD